MTPPQLTIGLPVAEQDPEIFARTVRSIFAQSFQEWELIVMLDGASSEVLQLAKQITDPRVSVVHDGQQKGLAARLNQIASLAASEYLARMDGDDLIHPDRFRIQMEQLKSQPDVDVVGCRCLVINERDEVKGAYGEMELTVDPKRLFKQVPFAHPTVVAKTEWFRKWPYDESILRAEDKDLWIRSAAHSTFLKLSAPLYYYRINDELNFDKYLRTYSDNRRVMRKLAAGNVSRYTLYKNLALSSLKEILVRASVAMGKTGWILRKRYSSIDQQLQVEANSAIAISSNTLVPGWS